LNALTKLLGNLKKGGCHLFVLCAVFVMGAKCSCTSSEQKARETREDVWLNAEPEASKTPSVEPTRAPNQEGDASKFEEGTPDSDQPSEESPPEEPGPGDEDQ
jgi:hypothetical protein